MRSTRLFLLNLMLVSAAVVFSVQLVRVYLASPDLPPAPPPRSPQATVSGAREGAPARAPLRTYEVIATRNLFNPSRAETATAAPTPSGKLFLYGVVLRDGAPVAFLGDPTTKKVRGYRPGDLVGDGEVERIEADRVVIRRNEDSTYEVLLRDPQKPKPAVAKPAKARPGVSAARPRPPRGPGVQPPAPVRPRPPSPTLFRRPQAPARSVPNR